MVAWLPAVASPEPDSKVLPRNQKVALKCNIREDSHLSLISFSTLYNVTSPGCSTILRILAKPDPSLAQRAKNTILKGDD